MALLKTNTGIGTTNPTSALHVIGDGLVTGVVTATTFNGDINSNTSSLGNASASQLYISGVSTFIGGITGTISTATKLQNPRTFEITGDVVASPITFDGTGNVSLAATIQPNSVGLGTDTFGDYVRNISGTANEITVTGGTGEGSTPVISFAPNPLIGGNVTIGNDLQVNNNLNVTGNITVGGTAGYILVNEFRVTDADIVLGFTTDISGNDVSNDTTANHGGIAIASTEGTPLITLTNPGVGETFPATYKKIMWFKAGSFAGLNTDAWLSNYAIGIGSTQFPSGTRLAAGSVQFTERDLAVVRNINASGIVTGSTFRPSSGYIQSPNGTNAFYIYDGTGNVAFQGTIGASQVNNASGFKVIGFAGTDITFENDARIGNNAYIVGVTTSVGGFVGNLTGTATTATNLSDAANITTGTINPSRLTGTYNIDISGNAATADYADLAGIATYANTAGVATYATNAGIATNLKGGVAGNVPYQSATDTTTFVTNGSSGQVLLFNGSIPIWSNVNSAAGAFNGITVYDEGNIVGSAGSIVSLDFVGSNLTVTGTSGTNGIATVTMSDNLVGTALSISGISTFSNNVSVGSGITMYASTGIISATAFYGSGLNLTDLILGRIEGLRIQNEGSNVGTGFSFATLNFIGDYVTATGIGTDANITFTTPPYALVSGIATYASSSGLSTSVIGGIGSISQLQVTGISTFTNGPVLVGSATSTGTAAQRLQVTGGAYVSGNLGIGTTNPRSTLDVRGSINVGGAVSITAERDSGNNDVIYFNPLNESRVSIGINTTLNWSSISGIPDVAFVADNSIFGFPKIAIANPTVADPHYALYAAYSTGIVPYGYVRQELNTASYAIALDNGPNAFSVGDRSSLSASSVSNFSSGNEAFVVLMNGSTSLFHSKSKKFETSGVGVTVYGNLNVGTSGTIFTTTSTGLVGVGTTNPTSKLHVIGSALITGVSTIGNFRITPVGTGATVGGIGVTYYGDGSQLSNIVTGVSISTNTTNQNQLITYAISTGSTTGFGVTATGLVFNPSTTRLGIGTTNPQANLYVVGDVLVTGVVTATTFSGNATSATNATTAGTATTATNINISATSSGDTTAYVVLVGDNVTGGQQPFIDNGSLTYNASTNVLTAGGGFSGDGSALTSLNASQLTSGTISGDRGVTSGSTSSSFVEYNGTTKTAGQFDGGTTDPTSTTRLNYDGYLYATRFYGDGSNLTTLNADNISSGTLSDARLPDLITSNINITSGVSTFATVRSTTFEGSLTGTASTSTTSTVTTSTTNSAFKVPFANTTANTTGNYELLQDSASTFTYNPSTDTLTVGTFSGSGASLTSLNASNISSGTIPGDRGVTAGSASPSFVEYNGTTATSGQFDGGSTTPSGTTRLNYGGYLYATRFYGDGSNLSALSASNISSGTLAIARGGTNSTATPTNGGVSYGTGSAFAFTSAGTSGQILQSAGAAAPVWSSNLNLSGIATLGTVQISSGIVTATTGVVTYYGDGSQLSGVVSPASNGEFYTGVSSSLQLTPLSYETSIYTFPATAGKQYVIESINVANVDTSVGVGTTVNIIASIEDSSGEQTYIAYNVPIVNGGLIELLKNPIVAGPSDVIKMWVTNDAYAGVNNAAEVYMNYSEYTSTEYVREYASTVSIATTDTTTVYTSSTYPSVIESIHLANRTDVGDYPVSVVITNGLTTTYLAKDLLIPRYATVDILDRPKRIETGATIGIKVEQTSTIDVIIAGKQITS